MQILPRAALAVAVLVLSAVAFAQDDAKLRSKAFGEVVDLAGKPWPKAQVTLVSQPVALLDDADTADVVEVVADEAGKFRAALLRHRAYSAWAMAPASDPASDPAKRDDSGVRMTAITEAVAAGTRTKLVEAKRRAFPVTLEFTGLEAWAERGPLRAQIRNAAMHGRVQAFEVGEDGKLTLPPMPGASCGITLLDKNGVPIYGWALTFSRKLQKSRRLTLKHIECFFAARDSNTGKGIADATIYWSDRGTMHPIGKTAKDGIGKFVVAMNPKASTLFVAAKGRAFSPARTGRARATRRKEWKPLREGVNPKFHVSMMEGVTYKGQILIGGKPARNIPLLQRGHAMYADGGTVNFVTFVQRVIRTDREGRFTFHGGAKGQFSTAISAVLASEHILQLPEAWHRQVHPCVNDVLDMKGGSGDLGAIELTRFCPMMLEVTDHSGLPAKGVSVAYGSKTTMSNYYAVNSGDFVTGRSGRLCTLVREADDLAISLRGANGSFFAKRLYVRKKNADHSLAFLRVKLKKPWTISGRVLSTKKKPVAGMMMYYHMHWGNVARAAEDPVRPEFPGSGNGVVVGDIDRATFSNCISMFTSGSKSVTTDKLGRFELTVPGVPMRWQIYGSKTFLFMKQRVNEAVELDDGPLKDIELTAK